MFLFMEMLAHVALFEDRYPDAQYPKEMVKGMRVVGPIATSGVWPHDPDRERCSAKCTIEEFLAGAWDMKAKIRNTFKRDDFSDKIYAKTQEDKAHRFCEGPFTEEDVDRHLGTKDWVPLRRFGVDQKGGIRVVDDAHENRSNDTTSRDEKLITSSVDVIVSMIRLWISIMGDDVDLGAWALDEFKAYRQIPVHPSERRYCVIAIVNPNPDPKTKVESPKIEYYVMNGHCFGHTAAVYNYNRRPLALNKILLTLFKIPTDFYYDDRWAIEPTATIASSYETTEEVMFMLGIRAQNDKAQGPPSVKVQDENGDVQSIETKSKTRPWKDPELLGVMFDLDRREVHIKPGRKEDLEYEINSILNSRSLSPGHAAKIRGKLFFLTGSLFGRIGRAFMRALSERQYEVRGPRKLEARDQIPYEINGAIEDALKSWLMIIDRGKPRPIRERRLGPADAVFFTDGRAPEPDDPPGTGSRIGGVLFAPWRENPVAFGIDVPEHVIGRWIPRKNQIALIELLAPVLLIHHFGSELGSKRVMGLIDSEPVLDALVKGQSKFKDVLELLKLFWDMVAEFGIDLYLDRVSTDANISDGVSRDKMDEAEEWGWNIEDVSFPSQLRSAEGVVSKLV